MADRKLWFGAKRYGWGWGMPCTWQGWVTLLVGVVALVVAAWIILPHQDEPLSIGRWAVFTGFLILDVLIMIILSYRHGEKPRWRWGGK